MTLSTQIHKQTNVPQLKQTHSERESHKSMFKAVPIKQIKRLQARSEDGRRKAIKGQIKNPSSTFNGWEIVTAICYQRRLITSKLTLFQTIRFDSFSFFPFFFVSPTNTRKSIFLKTSFYIKRAHKKLQKSIEHKNNKSNIIYDLTGPFGTVLSTRARLKEPGNTFDHKLANYGCY